ncbi:Antitoxin HicB [Ephemeroptericola cinctiostellae]|uniref:Antitoxin HicB n=1 Tax=Ephemeroptericola cinctiostellae TaxID=2268024 RepID=A0A345DEG6_9BURK|nr:type II toxin-antitoxin system HicB family antitoxin [Ephemeroptericola cinctiostellae]AXF86754.1 Antitoxin HicB [Ephemeroptericola cinctiostellae]
MQTNNAYPIELIEDTGGYVVTFPDIPEAMTQGDTLAEALEMAQDVLLSAMDFYFEDKRAVPMPSKAKSGQYTVALPMSAWAKVLLLNEVCAQQLRPIDVAHLMGTRPQYVNRILDLHHNTKIDTVAAALKAIGKDLTLGFA